MEKAHIGLIGLAVMGQNLARNIASRGYDIVVYNRTTEKMTNMIQEFGNEHLCGEEELKDFVEKIERPRKIMILVKAGKPVDMVIESLLPYLDPEDMIIDCGNSNFHDTIRREKDLAQKGFRFMGCGVSGGEEGALNGPSLMPGGQESAWKELQPILESIAAKDFNGGPCVTYIGENGAGHYVKMVHNGIEYGVMQMMAEAYDVLKRLYNLSAPEIAEIFAKYNEGKLNSFLFEIAIPVLKRKDNFQEGYLIDYILDKAGQKGTGKWTGIDALNRGITLPTITESVYARTVSAAKEQRMRISKLYTKGQYAAQIPLDAFLPILENALYAGMLSSYAQGYDLIQNAAKEQNWNIDLAEVARIWEGGCIIRAEILNVLHKAYQGTDTKNTHLFEIPSIQKELIENIPALRKMLAMSLEAGIPVSALAVSLSYFDSITSEKTSANLIQGLRDYFGAHTYERIDRDGNFHTEWLNDQ